MQLYIRLIVVGQLSRVRMSENVDFSPVPACSEALPQGEACHVRQYGAQILYDEYRTCYDSPILLPGFGILPRWLQAGAHRRGRGILTHAWPTLASPRSKARHQPPLCFHTYNASQQHRTGRHTR